MSNAKSCELWCVDLGAAAAALSAIESHTPRLVPADHHRAAAIADSRTRAEWLATHIALRLVIEHAVGASWRGVAFVRDAGGKPRLPGAPITFSLSHAPGVALLGVSRRGWIGVDVERQRTVRIDAIRKQRIRDAGDAIGTAPLPAPEEAAFLQAWVRLEAYAKAEACGVGRLLTQLGIFGPGARQASASVDTRTRAATLLAAVPGRGIHDLQLGAGIFAAVACADG
ncbi:MAG: hypothetical protein WC829_19620, partial [Hyphomicrobium sp.]